MRFFAKLRMTKGIMRKIIILMILLPMFGTGCFDGIRVDGGVGRDVPRDVSTKNTENTTTTHSNSLMPIPNTFIDPQKFASTNSIKGSALSVAPVAGVVNHHDLAADLQSKFFKTLKAARPDLKTIIIISPDHYKACQSISTHQLAYSTSAGRVEVDPTKVQSLVAAGIWDATEARAFEKEHGVGALAPFIAREFPNAKIVPIFIRANATHAKLLALVGAIKQIQDRNTFIIISSDMSHTLPLEQARVRDVQTEQWLEQMDPTVLENATDANTDSGPALFVLSTLLKQPKFTQIAHTISSDYVADTKNTTSYIVGFWSK